MIQALPANLNLDQILSENPPHEIPKFNRAHAVYLLDLLTSIPSRNKMIGSKIRDRYVPLNAQLMQRHVRDYDKYLAYFTRVGIIETTGAFSRGINGAPGASRCYRFQTAYTNQPLQFVPSSDQKLNRKLKKARVAALRTIPGGYDHLLRWLEPDGRLQIDGVAARAFAESRMLLQRTYPSLLKVKQRKKTRHLKVGKKHYTTRRKEYTDPQEQRLHAEYNILCFEEQDLRASVDEKVRRFHSTLTNMSGTLRHFLTFEGEPLVSVDIANSQPYLANILLRSEFYEDTDSSEATSEKHQKGVEKITCEEGRRAQTPPPGGKRGLRYSVEGRRVWEEEGGINKENPYTTLVKKGHLFDGEDVMLFEKLTSSGTLYDYLRAAFREQLGADYDTKENAKVTIFEVLFAGNGHNSKTKTIFCNLFPTVASVFHVFKCRDKTVLPRLLQMLEAHVVLQVITKRITREKRGQVPLFTIHDSIATTQKYVQYVHDVMHEELTRLVGVSPTLKVEVWSAANADLYLHNLQQKATAVGLPTTA